MQAIRSAIETASGHLAEHAEAARATDAAAIAVCEELRVRPGSLRQPRFA
jgi:hypothetical protein